jgi:hypothetical protein
MDFESPRDIDAVGLRKLSANGLELRTTTRSAYVRLPNAVMSQLTSGSLLHTEGIHEERRKLDMNIPLAVPEFLT